MQNSESDEPFFVVIETIIFKGKRYAPKHQRCVTEIQLMVDQIATAFAFIP